jgi:hypothetical protein
MRSKPADHKVGQKTLQQAPLTCSGMGCCKNGYKDGQAFESMRPVCGRSSTAIIGRSIANSNSNPYFDGQVVNGLAIEPMAMQ